MFLQPSFVSVNRIPFDFKADVTTSRSKVIVEDAFTPSWLVRIKLVERLTEQLVPESCQEISRWDFYLHILSLWL